MNSKYYKRRKDISDTLRDTLYSTRNYSGVYENYRANLEELSKKIAQTSLFSVLIFYEFSKNKITLKKIKDINKKIPEDFTRGSGFSYQQFYFMPELKEKRIGNSLGTAYRETQSMYALIFSETSKIKNVPTHILIKDTNNKLKHILSSKKFIVFPHDISLCNNMKGIKSIDEFLKNTQKAYAFRDNNQKIEGINIDNIY